MKVLHSNIFCLIAIFAITLTFNAASVFADGSDTLGLGPASIDIEAGTSIVVAGVGMAETISETIYVDVPSGADVKQVLLYWNGYTDGSGPSTNQNEITVNGMLRSVDIDLPIGMAENISYCYRDDITDIVQVTAGKIEVTVEDMGFKDIINGGVNNGAGILVVFDDGSDIAEIDIRDGHDYAYYNAPTLEFQETIPQTFTFSPAQFDRTANLSMFFSSVAGTASSGGFRPTIIEITVGGITKIESNHLNSNDGEEWDSVNLLVDIPAGATEMKVQAFSEGIDPPELGKEGNPASFIWIAAGFSIIPPPGGEGCTPGYWKQGQHFWAWEETSYTPGTLFSDVFEDAFSGMTLLEVLKQGGGGLNALGRHAVAALLNASSSITDYDLMVPEIKMFFNDVFPDGTKDDYNSIKNIFEGFNEQGCPLGNSDDEIENNEDLDIAMTSSDITRSDRYTTN